jgi:hypothetical protein
MLPALKGRGVVAGAQSSNLCGQTQRSQHPRVRPIVATVPVVAIALIWRATNQEALANQKVRWRIDIPGILALDPHRFNGQPCSLKRLERACRRYAKLGAEQQLLERMLRCWAATTRILQQRGLPQRQLSFGRFPSSTGPAWYPYDRPACRNLEDLSRARFFSQQGHATVFGCSCSTQRSRRCDMRYQERACKHPFIKSGFGVSAVLPIDRRVSHCVARLGLVRPDLMLVQSQERSR